MTDNRRSGVTFGALQDDLEVEDYPLSTEELLERYGAREMAHANGSVTLREVIEPMGEESYRSANEVQQAVLNMIGEGAEGRKEYTDREPNARGANFEQQSF